MKTIGVTEISDNADIAKLQSQSFRDVVDRLHDDYGYKVVEGAHLRSSVHDVSPQDRADDINTFFADPKIDMVWPVGGGWCSNEILPYLDYEMIARNPKPFMGFSGITVVSNALWARSGLLNFSGPSVSRYRHTWYGSDQMWEQFDEIFVQGTRSSELWNLSTFVDFDEITEDNPSGIVHDEGTLVLRDGTASGTIIGGNLSSLCVLTGTPWMPSLDGGILFLEECGEASIGDIRRDLVSLRQSCDFSQLQGLVFGKINRVCNRLIELDWHTTIMDVFGDLTIPIIVGGPFGHISPMQIFPIGGRCTLDTSQPKYEMNW